MSNTQNQVTALSVQGVRAWYAAQSGYEWTLKYLLDNNACPTVLTSMTVEGFTVTLEDCVGPDANPVYSTDGSYLVSEAGETYKVFDIEISAVRGSFGSTDFVSRTLRATVGGP